MASEAARGSDRFESSRIKCVLFDALALFDLRQLQSTAETLVPGQGLRLIQAWHGRLFEYQWLHALAGRYIDFWSAATDSLSFAARTLGVLLPPDLRAALLRPLAQPMVWADAPEALKALRSSGLALGILSNMTGQMLRAGLQNAQLDSLFAHVLSTDQVRSFKPARVAYQLGLDASGLRREEVLFVAFAGWDAAGATWFGYPTFWLNRNGSTEEELGAKALGTGTDLAALPLFLNIPSREPAPSG
jgi:2-haloacid dehalogenase